MRSDRAGTDAAIQDRRAYQSSAHSAHARAVTCSGNRSCDGGGSGTVQGSGSPRL
jgi:hypothetical protein